MTTNRSLGRARTAAAGLALLFAGCADADTASAIEASALEDIVLSAADTPDGMEFNATDTGPGTVVGPLVTARADEALRLSGFVDGRASSFSGEAGFLLSWAAVFETAEQADAAFTLYADEFADPAAYALDPTPEADLGDEGMCDRRRSALSPTR